MAQLRTAPPWLDESGEAVRAWLAAEVAEAAEVAGQSVDETGSVV